MQIKSSQPGPAHPAPHSPKSAQPLPAEELICRVDAPATADQAQLGNPLGSAVQSLPLGNPPPTSSAPPIRLLGLKQGDRLEVDGATTADGTARVQVLNEKAFELKAEINIPYLARGLADDSFALSGGKVNLSIKLTREGDKYRYQLLDNNAGGKIKGSGLSELKISEGSKTEQGFWGGSEKFKTQSLTIKTSDGDLSIQLKQNSQGKVSGSVTIPGLPSLLNSFDLDKL
ncbi:MAG: hypothetical protein CVV27_16645 [Candidatus Melainabacteria bacterium HGW-Melainabacteria-1]|nr:MAG: hypothetical protein CVV27_16645 [Candidatus Melainabacteria bacterium HGW-Melainabacteria-1]